VVLPTPPFWFAIARTRTFNPLWRQTPDIFDIKSTEASSMPIHRNLTISAQYFAGYWRLYQHYKRAELEPK
jgi:hypothetical protein